jgi:hypothetical protein
MNVVRPSSPPRMHVASSASLFAVPALTVGLVAPRSLGSDAITWARAELERELGKMAENGAGRALSALTGRLEHELAEIVLGAGFSLEAVVPSRAFAASLEAAERAAFEGLLARAADRTILTYEKTTDASLEAAARFIVYYSDTVIVVLEDDAARRSTAILDYARDHKRQVLVVDPLEKRISHGE